MPSSASTCLAGTWWTPPRLHTGCWLLAVFCFAGVGLAATRQEAARPRRASAGPDAALEMHADFAAGQAGALGPLRAVIERLPTARGILVLRDSKLLSAALGSQVIHYLAWPRVVKVQEAAPGTQGGTLAELQAKYTALVLCGWHAPGGFPHLRRIGPGLEIVLLSGEPVP